MRATRHLFSPVLHGVLIKQMLRPCCKALSCPEHLAAMAVTLSSAWRLRSGSLCLQQIQFRRTAKAPVEVAVLCEMADAASADNARILAMLNLSPIISFLFNSEGKLVQANKKGMQKYGHIGECTLVSLGGPRDPSAGALLVGCSAGPSWHRWDGRRLFGLCAV